MKHHPFASKTFMSIWAKHFYSSKEPYHFKALSNIGFAKCKTPYLYYNIGKNITNGMSYSIDSTQQDYKNKVFLVHDVPSYFNFEDINSSRLKRIKVGQYKGFLSRLNDFESYDDFVKSQFKSNSRYKFKRNQQRLETCFDITYSIYHGALEKPEYERIMKGFKKLLTKRFNALEKDNDILETWDYYHDLIYGMLTEKKALLITIYNKETPIGVSLSFLSDSTMYYAITSFDTDYYRFNLGHTTIIKLFQWCFENGYTIYDFSKGEYEYKNRWTNSSYCYENHILYDSKNPITNLIAQSVKLKYRFKQHLRDKHINEFYVKLKFYLKGKKGQIKKGRNYKIEALTEGLNFNDLVLINIEEKDYSFLKPIVYDNLYKKPEPIKNINIYHSNIDNTERYHVKADKNNYTIVFN